MTWDSLIEAYLTAQTLRGRTSIAKMRASLDRFVRTLAARGERPVAEAIGPAHLAAYQIDLAAQPLSAHTVYGCLVDLRSFLRWATRHGHILLDPTADWDLPHPPAPLFRLLTVAEVERLLEAPDPATPQGLRDRAMMECLYGLALRLAECHGLNVADLDFGTQTVRVARVKGGRTRFLPLPPHLAGVLQAYLERGRPALAARSTEPALWLSRQGGGARLGKPQFGTLLEGYAHAQGLPRVSPHKLRHAAASHLLEAGADIRVVQELLGHAVVSSTQLYTQLIPEAVVKTHRRTHPRSRRVRRP